MLSYFILIVLYFGKERTGIFTETTVIECISFYTISGAPSHNLQPAGISQF